MREIKKTTVGRVMATREDTASRPHSRMIGPPGAARRKRKMKAMGEMEKKPVSRSSRKQLKPCALTYVPLCTPLIANSSSGRVRSMHRSRQ
jgi:hypothetical protein